MSPSARPLSAQASDDEVRVTLLQEAVADLRRLEDFAIERELASETRLTLRNEHWTPSRWNAPAVLTPYSCRRRNWQCPRAN